MTLTPEQEQQLDAFTRVPWTVSHSSNEDEGYHVLRVAELPEVLATGRTEAELSAAFWSAMRAALASRLEDGDVVPLPKGYKPPASTMRVRPSRPVHLEWSSWQHEDALTGASGVPVISN